MNCNMFRILNLSVVTILSIATTAIAADWPERPVNMIVAYGAGGGTDTLSRIVAEPLSENLGQPVVIINRPGAGGTIGADAVAKSPVDGYTFYMMANGHTIAAAMYKELPYNPVTDFQGVSLVAKLPLIVVARPDFKANNLKELVAFAKKEPGELTYASVGVGSTQHFAVELLMEKTGMKMLHIPYQKTPEALAAVLSGEVDILIEVVAPMIGQVQSGDIKALALTTIERHPNLPDVGTVAEAGFDGFDVATWYGIAAPAGIPKDILDKASAAIAKTLGSAEMKAKLLKTGYVATSSSPDEFNQHIAKYVKQWSEVRESINVKQR